MVIITIVIIMYFVTSVFARVVQGKWWSQTIAIMKLCPIWFANWTLDNFSSTSKKCKLNRYSVGLHNFSFYVIFSSIVQMYHTEVIPVVPSMLGCEKASQCLYCQSKKEAFGYFCFQNEFRNRISRAWRNSQQLKPNEMEWVKRRNKLYLLARWIHFAAYYSPKKTL